MAKALLISRLQKSGAKATMHLNSSSDDWAGPRILIFCAAAYLNGEHEQLQHNAVKTARKTAE